MSVLESVVAGDRRGALAGVARVLAAAIDAEVDEGRLDALSRELRIVLRELEGLVDGGSNSRGDALAARRKAKEAAAG